jgi:predicted RNase H-like HicB family nuclease
MKHLFTRCFVPDEIAGYAAYALEYPGCYAQGATLAEAYDALDAAAESWCLGMEARGCPVPPLVESGHHAQKAIGLWRK